MAAGWPKLADVRTVLRLTPDPAEDAVIDSARLAAISYGVRRLGNQWPADATDLDDAAYEACLIHAANLYRRRDSTDGTIGWGDMGVVRVTGRDPTVENLYAQIAPLVFG